MRGETVDGYLLEQGDAEMSKKDNIKNAANAVAAHGYTLSPSLQKMVADIETPQFRVAVVGQYQVGKSTLINKVFLGDRPLLAEGRGLCTTAVATDIEYGPASKLEVYHWLDNKHEADVCSKTVENPTVDDVNAATVSNDMSTRSELAQRVSRVKILTPNEVLRGYTVIDTPGLDDPEEELLANTTYRIIPGTDVALLVVEARQLSDVELKFLRNDIIGRNGISRLLLLISYNAKRLDLDDTGRTDIVKTIKAQLSNIGRDDIEVEMYCFDPAIGDIMSEVAEIRMTIRTFLEENALPGREEKLSALMKNELEAIQVEIAAQLKAVGASESEVAEARKRLEEEVARFKQKCESAFESLKNEFGSIRDQMYNDVDLAVEGVFSRFYTQMETAVDVGAVKAISEKAEQIIKSDLQSQISIIGLKLKEKIASAIETYSSRISSVQTTWDLYLSSEFGVKRPFVTKIPSIVWDVVNVGLLDIILPGGWIIATVAHLLGKPVFNPTAWSVKKLVLSQMKSALDESQGEVRQQIMDQIVENLRKSFANVKALIEDTNRKQVEAIQNGFKNAKDSNVSADRAKLESAKADIEAALANL